MTIPATITAELTSLQAQVKAASPLNAASRPTILALQLNAINLVNDVQAALTAPNNLLDTWTAPVDPVSITAGILNVFAASQDQFSLSVMRGVVGRVADNLEQLV
jgi:hypothetical protein